MNVITIEKDARAELDENQLRRGS